MSDNDKTKEQLLKEKQARFNNDPDSFVETDKLLFAVMKQPEGLALCVGRGTMQEFQSTLGIAVSEITAVINFIKVQAQKQQRVITPQRQRGMFKRFVRGH